MAWLNLPTVLGASTALWLLAYLVIRLLFQRGRLARDYHRDLAALGLLALLTVGFFWRLVFAQDTWMPAGGGDLASFLFPAYRFAAQSLRSGLLPLWNPYLNGGAPFVADIQMGLFYPINLAVFILAPQITYETMEFLSALHFFLAGAFMYLCLRGMDLPPPASRRPRLGRVPALFGSVAFMFSDLFVVHFGNYNLIAAAAWLPLVFLFYNKALASGRLSPSGWAGLFLGLAILAGHIQPVLYTVFFLTLFALYCGLIASLGPYRLRVLAQAAVALAVTLVVALGLAAVVLLPAYELAGLSVRSQIGYRDSIAYSLAPAQLIGMFMPSFFGRGAANYWGPWDRVEVGYLGVLPLILALWALASGRNRLTAFLGLAATFSLALSMGGYTVLYGWLFQFVPGFDKVRAPARFVYLFDFAVAILAALGLESLMRPLAKMIRARLRRATRYLALVFLLITLITVPLTYAVLLVSQDKDPVIFQRIAGATNGLAFFLAIFGSGVALFAARRFGWLRPAALGWLVVALAALELLSTGSGVDVTGDDPSQGFHHPQAVRFLRQDRSYYRIDSNTGAWDAWQPDTGLLNRIQEVWGAYNPMTLADYKAYWENMGSRSARLYDFLNVKYVIGHKNVPLDWNKFVPVFDGDPQVNVYLNTGALPRAFLVTESQVLPSRTAILSALRSPDFDPSRTVLLEKGRAIASRPLTSAIVDITDYSADRVDVATEGATESYLVISEVFYPGWQATVDGHGVEILRANYAFRAVYLPPGKHQVRFSFIPLTFRAGALISGLTMVALAVGLLRRGRSGFRGGTGAG